MPDAVKEQERMKHATLHDFLRAVVVPEMQIKLRQGFGRAIRTETDTCVVAILDERAGKDRRYFRDVLTALPEVPVTHSLKDVERFIRAVNIKTELQYRIALGILGQMCSAGLVNDQEAETIRRLAAEKYRPETVRGL